MDSPAQDAKGIPVKKVTVSGNKVTFEVAVANATFKGQLEKNSATIKGNWQQSGQTFVVAPANLPKPYADSSPNSGE